MSDINSTLYMNPHSPLPKARYFKAEALIDAPGFLEASVGLMPSAPIKRKPLRPSKEPLPVAYDVKLDSVLNQSSYSSMALAESIEPAHPFNKEPSSVKLSKSFLGGADNGVSIPPDSNGAVSNTHIFTPLNDFVYIYDRAGKLVSKDTLDDFWGTDDDAAFDPKVIFDPFEKRFIFVSMVNGAKSTSALLIAVTETDDPTGEWFRIPVPVDTKEQGNVWLDYPSVGFTNDKITVQVNMFTLGANKFAGSTIYVFDKREFYDPPHIPSFSHFILTDKGGVQVPAITYDAAMSDQYLVGRWSGNIDGIGHLALYKVTGNVIEGTLELFEVGMIQSLGHSWASRSQSGDLLPQLGSSKLIDGGDDRLISVVYRNGSLWCSHTIYLPASNPTKTAAQWWQLDAEAGEIQQLGRIQDLNGPKFYAYPSISVNQDNVAVLGLSEFSKDQHPSAAFTYRLSTDPEHSMRPPVVYAEGQSSYFKDFGRNKNKWGDYSSTQVDPINDKDFWTIQEFASAQKNMWAVQWGYIVIG